MESYSRRAFIERLFKASLAAGGIMLPGAGLLYAKGIWDTPAVSGRPEHIGDYKDELFNKAPLARFWASANDKIPNCFACHTPAEQPLKPHEHKTRLIKCLLCAQYCSIEEGARGKCRTRVNINGRLHSLSYGRPVSIHTDPIEKKPFYHFLPGAQAYSLATAGCPLSCQFCQNWQISQASPEDYEVKFIMPETHVKKVLTDKTPVIAFTYNEPTVFAEYMIDIAIAARKNGIRTALVSCGFMNEAPLKELCSVLDAIKIDLKGFSSGFYNNVCSASLKPVLRSIKQIADSGTHLEIVNLVVPTLNDSDSMLNGLADWITGEIGFDVPVHFTRFHPDYRLQNLPPTPVAALERARDIAMKKGIHYAFVGNVPGHIGNNTYCPKCGKSVIARSGFFVTESHIINGSCGFCKCAIAGIWR